MDGHLRPTLLGRLIRVDLKIETRQPVEGPLSDEFPAICNHCGVTTTGLKSQDLRIL